MARNYILVDFKVEKPQQLDSDQWVALLNVIRRKFCETPELSRHGLNAHLIADKDTVDTEIQIGIVLPNSKYFGHFDNDSIVSIFEDWNKSNQLTDLLAEAPSVGVPTFEQLKVQGSYPQDARDLYEETQHPKKSKKRS